MIVFWDVHRGWSLRVGPTRCPPPPTISVANWSKYITLQSLPEVTYGKNATLMSFGQKTVHALLSIDSGDGQIP